MAIFLCSANLVQVRPAEVSPSPAPPRPWRSAAYLHLPDRALLPVARAQSSPLPCRAPNHSATAPSREFAELFPLPWPTVVCAAASSLCLVLARSRFGASAVVCSLSALARLIPARVELLLGVLLAEASDCRAYGRARLAPSLSSVRAQLPRCPRHKIRLATVPSNCEAPCRAPVRLPARISPAAVL
jgi:hypothetical protein